MIHKYQDLPYHVLEKFLDEISGIPYDPYESSLEEAKYKILNDHPYNEQEEYVQSRFKEILSDTPSYFFEMAKSVSENLRECADSIDQFIIENRGDITF